MNSLSHAQCHRNVVHLYKNHYKYPLLQSNLMEFQHFMMSLWKFAMDEFKDALPNLFERSANDNLIALIFSITKATLTTSDSMV